MKLFQFKNNETAANGLRMSQGIVKEIFLKLNCTPALQGETAAEAMTLWNLLYFIIPYSIENLIHLITLDAT